MNVSGVNVQSKSGVKWRKNTTLRVRGERSLGNSHQSERLGLGPRKALKEAILVDTDMPAMWELHLEYCNLMAVVFLGPVLLPALN